MLSGDVWVPNQQEFERHWLHESPAGHYYGASLHANPVMFKSSWRIWTPGYRYEGEAFFAEAPLLCTAEFKALEEQSLGFRIHYFVYDVRRPRRLAHRRRAEPDMRFVAALEDDQDPEWRGHR